MKFCAILKSRKSGTDSTDLAVYCLPTGTLLYYRYANVQANGAYCLPDAEVVPATDDDSAHGGSAGGPRLMLVDGSLRPARLAAAAACAAFQQ